MANSSFRNGRRVVLKPLDDDCLLDGELHPSIALRLERVRELPMTAVANLHGVELIDGRAVLVWDYVEGRTLEQILGTLDKAAHERLKRDVQLVVEQLHGLGIVHGALHGRNVIVDDRGAVRITHVSPLLHSDERVDFAALERLFGDVDGAEVMEQPAARDGIRMRAAAGAVLAIVIGAAVVISILWYAWGQP